MGGIVLDIDTICIKPLDELIYKYTFFAGMEPPTLGENCPSINAGLIASSPNNTIVNTAIDMFNRYWIDKRYRLLINNYASAKDAKGTDKKVGFVIG